MSSEFILLPEPFMAKNAHLKLPPAAPTKTSDQTPKDDSNSVDPPILSNDVTDTTSVQNSNSEPIEPKPPSSKCSCKPSALLQDILDGKTDGGTARSRSQIPKGVQLPTGMLAVDDDHESSFDLDYEPITYLADEDHTAEIAMASNPTVEVTDDDPKSLAEAKD